MKTALITGASGGIGRATAIKFLQNGYFVIAQYNTDIDGIKQLNNSLTEEQSQRLFTIKADFNNADGVNKMISDVLKSFARLDVVVNNAGVGLYKLITQTEEGEWDKLFNVNVKSAFIISKRVLPAMINAGHGSIINVSSMWGNVGASMEVGYSASKSALIGFSKALAKEVAPSGIRVNCVCPGVIDTKMNARFSEEDIVELKNQTPLGRIGSAQEVANLIYFLSSEEASFITGQTISCDGGFSL